LPDGIGTPVEAPPEIDGEHLEASLFRLSPNVGKSASVELVGG
jgi:hypothetical protein